MCIYVLCRYAVYGQQFKNISVINSSTVGNGLSMELEQISTPHSRWIFGGNGDFKNSVSVKENGYGEILISISIKNGVDMDMDMEYPSPLASLHTTGQAQPLI